MEKINWKFVLTNGIIGSLFLLIYSMLTYFFYANIFTNYWLMTLSGLLMMAAVLFFLIWCGINYRKMNNGYVSFPIILVVLFSIGMFMNATSNVFSYILPNYIDTEYPIRISEIMKTSISNQMEKMGAPDEQIEAQINRLSADQFKPTIVASFKNLGIAAFFYLIVSTIIAAFIKRNSQDIIDVKTR